MTVVVAGLVATACTTSPEASPPPATPQPEAAHRVVAGVVYGRENRPVKGALVQLDVLDHANAVVGQPVPAVVHLEGTSATDGTFTFFVEPTAEVRDFAAGNSNHVNFTLLVVGPDGTVYPGWSFSRELAAGGWQGDVPELILYPDRTDELP